MFQMSIRQIPARPSLLRFAGNFRGCCYLELLPAPVVRSSIPRAAPTPGLSLN